MKKNNALKLAVASLVLVLLLAFIANAARLPSVGGDSGGWGSVLNEFLAVGHTAEGNHKNATVEGDLIVGNSVLYVNGTSGNVGIGTTGPNGTLDVRPQIAASGAGKPIILSAQQGAPGEIGGNLIFNSGPNGVGAPSPGNGYIAFGIGSTFTENNLTTEKMRIAANGNIGIGGEPNPASKVEMRTSSTGTGFGGTDGAGALRISFATGYGIGIDTWDNGAPRWGILNFNSDTPIVMMEGVYSSTNVIFNSGGSVGIGTTSPFAKLEVNTSSGTVGIATNGSVGIGTTGPLALFHIDKQQDAFTGQYVTNGNAGTLARAGILVGQSNSGSNYGAIEHFGTGFAADGVRIADRTSLLGWDTGGLAVGTYTDYPVIFAQSNSEVMRISDTGNLGIGTTTPSAKLYVNGNTTTGNLTVTNLTGVGNDYVCVNPNGNLFRSDTAC